MPMLDSLPRLSGPHYRIEVQNRRANDYIIPDTSRSGRSSMPRKSAKHKIPKLDALPDTLDFRDRMFEATLIEVPTNIQLTDYRRWKIPILDQGREGACTGFGLATVANYLLTRRKVMPDKAPVSPRMF